jgi:hypothetical protein
LETWIKLGFKGGSWILEEGRWKTWMELDQDGSGWRLDWGESILDATWIEVNVLDEGGSCVFGGALKHGCKGLILGWKLDEPFSKLLKLPITIQEV